MFGFCGGCWGVPREIKDELREGKKARGMVVEKGRKSEMGDLTDGSLIFNMEKEKSSKHVVSSFYACGSNRIRTYDVPGMNRTLWPAELLSQMVAGAGLEPATSGL